MREIIIKMGVLVFLLSSCANESLITGNESVMTSSTEWNIVNLTELDCDNLDYLYLSIQTKDKTICNQTNSLSAWERFGSCYIPIKKDKKNNKEFCNYNENDIYWILTEAKT